MVRNVKWKTLSCLLLCLLLPFISCKQGQQNTGAEISAGIGSNALAQIIEIKADGKAVNLNTKFFAATKNYKAEIPFKAKKISIVCKPSAPKAKVYTPAINLPEEGGAGQIIAIKVVSENKEAEEIYTVQLLRSFPSGENRAESLTLYANDIIIPFAEAFYPNKTDYSAILPHNFDKDLILKAQTYSIYAESKPAGLKASDFPAPDSGKDVTKVLEAEVKAENGAVKKYKVTLTKRKDENAAVPYLTAVSVFGVFAAYDSYSGGWIAEVPVEAAFDDIKKNIKPVCNPAAEIKIEQAVSSEFPSQAGAEKLFIITVSLKNGTAKNYKLTVIRRKPEQNIKSNNARLLKIEFRTEPKNFSVPAVDCTQHKSDLYNISVSKKIEKIGISAIPEDPKAKVSISPPLKTELLPNQPKEFIIEVMAEDGSIKKTLVTVTKSLNGLVKILSEKTTITKTDLPWLTESQKRNPMFTGAFFENDVTLIPFELGMYAVTYKLWYDVRIWAEDNGYVFANKGCEGTKTGKLIENRYFEHAGVPPSFDGQYKPVTAISYRDMIVWCNAYSEMNDFEPVYYFKGEPLKSAESCKLIPHPAADGFYLYYYDADAATVKIEANGYRLPYQAEWEFAARGGDVSKPDWNFAYPGVKGYEDGKPIISNQAYTEDAIADYMWYFKNSKSDTGPDIHEVGEKLPNRLGLFDLGGNVYEICGDIKPYINAKDPRDDKFIITACGGSYQSEGIFAMQVSKIMDTGYTETKARDYGFRLARSIGK